MTALRYYSPTDQLAAARLLVAYVEGAEESPDLQHQLAVICAEYDPALVILALLMIATEALEWMPADATELAHGVRAALETEYERHQEIP